MVLDEEDMDFCVGLNGDILRSPLSVEVSEGGGLNILELLDQLGASWVIPGE